MSSDLGGYSSKGPLNLKSRHSIINYRLQASMHHRRYRNQHDGSKRGSSKVGKLRSALFNNFYPYLRPLSSRRTTNISARKENSISKRNQAVTDHKSRSKPSVSKSNEKITAVKIDDSDYVDFSSPLNTESTILSTKSHRQKSSVKSHNDENLVERLMRTTTKDPSKKHPGDQGIEYSDYYSEDDVLQDIAANKIPLGVVETGNPNDRFARGIVNSTSLRDDYRIDRNVQPYYQDYDSRGKDIRYTDDSLDNFQNYPSIERFSGLNRNSRLHGPDEISYEANRGYLDDGSENLEAVYPVSTEVILEPQMPEQIPDDTGVQSNLDVPDLNNVDSENEMRSFDSKEPDQFSRLSQYETQQEYLGNSDNNDPRNFNLGDTSLQLENLRVPQNGNPVMEVPQFSNSFDTSEMQNPYNYRQGGTNQHFDQNMANPSQVGSIRPSSMEEEDSQSQPQLNNFPTQVKNNYHNNQNNAASLNVANAMNLPLGKVLESLGINVNTDSMNSVNQNSNSEEKLKPATASNSLLHPVEKTSVALASKTLNRPVEHILSPNYLKKDPREELNRDDDESNIRGSDSQPLRMKNDNLNFREGHIRRQSGQNGFQSNNLLPFTNDDNNAAHNVNISIAMHDTKEVASQILDTIMEELEELKFDHAKNNKREGLPCRLSGSWSTAQAGMKLDMKVVNHSIIVTLSDFTSPRFHESLLNGTWNISGHAPFKRGSPFTLIATDNTTNSLAVFVGACRVCQGIDTIAGVWSVARKPKDCRDFQVATSVFNDIFRKTKLSTLKEKQHTANTGENATAKSEKKRS
ncbi:uncharacterized protein LOC143179561 [Calliopsis andreniformis]|uniref:uncharacterized protein LOC143179561 n=1 Tax=Calliopsis andreniformis TaxID=337506 RepID=UPI003FCD9708